MNKIQPKTVNNVFIDKNYCTGKISRKTKHRMFNTWWKSCCKYIIVGGLSSGGTKT